MTAPKAVARKTIRMLVIAMAAALLPLATVTAPAGAETISALTKRYVETFYPLWLTQLQFDVAPHNRLIGPDIVNPLYQGVVAINNDTLYASSPVDTSGGPVMVTVPRTPASYSVLLLDAFGNTYPVDIPSKQAGVNTPTKVYGLVAPGYRGGLPAGVTRVRLPHPFMILIFRADRFSDNRDLTAQAGRFRAALRMQTLSAWRANPQGGATAVRSVAEFALPVKTMADTLINTAPVEFLRQTQRAVGDGLRVPPLAPRHRALADAFNRAFAGGADPAVWPAVSSGARAAHAAIIGNYLSNRDRNNWIHFTNIGKWGNNVLDRASLNEFIQFGNGISTAAYYHAFRDGNGAPLDGNRPGGYTLTFPANAIPDASRFWSLTAYTPNSIELIPNAADKYLVAGYTPGLVRNRDGSITIHIARVKPAGVPEANWLPVGFRPFNVMLRLYGVIPGSGPANNTYVPPPVVAR
ncbi:MAG: DUF1214 domain-containing protein [Actinomycetota bacterium]|nr:DUF1214 domain-containing protein [Actinomycetota bacterium]